jgi:hypothetical protein
VTNGVDWVPPHVRAAGDHTDVPYGTVQIMFLAIVSVITEEITVSKERKVKRDLM